MLAAVMTGSGSLGSLLIPAGALFGLGLGLVCGVRASWGGGLATHAGDYTIQNWQVEEGLPQISVTAITQTPDGYLWLGTFNGLVRFDGVRFTVFHEGNTPGLGSSGITALEVDDEGALVIATIERGLVRMSGGQFAAISGTDAVPVSGGFRFLHDSSRRLLLLDSESGLWRVEKGHVRPQDLTDRALGAADACLLIAEGSGATHVVHQGKVTKSLRVTLPANAGSSGKGVDLAIHCAAASRSGGYWLATETGIYRLQGGRLSDRLAPLPPKVTNLFSLEEDAEGNLWGARWSKGVYRWDPRGSWQEFSTGSGLADSHVNGLFRDREGNLWVATGQGGLHRIRPRVFRMYTTESGPNVVMSLTQDRQGRMWFGVNGGGLHTWADEKLKPVSEPALLRSYPLAYSVLADRRDGLWVGLYGLKVLRWHADAVTTYDLDLGSSQPMTPQALFEDRAGAVWFGCTHGLLRYEDGRFACYTTREGLSCDTVTALAEDRSGTLYIGTDGGGLNSYRDGRFTSFTERDGLAENHVSSLYVDGDDTLWIGTVNRGLSRFKQGRFATASIKDGLPTDTVGNLIEDDLGNLWLGSNRGIIRVARRALNEYLDGKRSSAPWQVFGLSDGLGTIGCGGASQPASCKARDGRLWFSTIKGVAVVNPDQLAFNPLPPPVVIEEVTIDDRVQVLRGTGAQPDAAHSTRSKATVGLRPATSGSSSVSRIARDKSTASSGVPGLIAPPRSRRVEFRFTGLSLVAAEKVRFRYRLSGLDENWREAGSERIAAYNHVPPGNYRFEVTACNNDGVWNETGATLGLVVLPPWWMTWWFRVLTVIGVSGLVFGWYEVRLHRLRRERQTQQSFSRRLIASQENERQRLAGELHDGLGQDLLVIASQAQLSLGQAQNPPAIAARLQDIVETARQAIQQARRMAHNLRPGLIEEMGFTKAVRANADKAAQASGISMAIASENVDGLLPPEFEVSLFRIVQESLNNVLKHAGASEVRITLTRQPNGLRLLVQDNGRGFEPDRLESVPPDQRGFGLRQMAERAKMMGGRLDLQSRPGQGTRLTVEVPMQGSRFHP